MQRYTYSGIALHNKDSKTKEYHLLTEIFSLPNKVVKTYKGLLMNSGFSFYHLSRILHGSQGNFLNSALLVFCCLFVLDLLRYKRTKCCCNLPKSIKLHVFKQCNNKNKNIISPVKLQLHMTNSGLGMRLLDQEKVHW